MKVGIVGAGISGLSAARQLHYNGHKVVVFERAASVGGRVSTIKKDGFVWDTGATSIAPRGKRIERFLLEELHTEDLVKIEKPIYVHSGLRVSPGSNGTPRYTFAGGNVVLAQKLAEGLDIRLNQNVDEIERANGRFQIEDEGFDAIILSAPIPQTSLLLWRLGENRPTGNVRYRPCLSLLLGYDAPLPRTQYHALLDTEQLHPMTWLCLESVKAPGRAPEGGTALVAQLSATYSHVQYEQDDQFLVQTVTGFVERLYGPSFQSPKSWNVIRWKYSQPESLATFENVNPKGSRILVASDGLVGGHIEDAFEVGTRTASLLVEED
ncbi:MAG: FAD-dependent oxidoreductase [Fimbriimonas sp.]|nr:FAD-dependent oxidoreductase [Fimbriimonas sp.]